MSKTAPEELLAAIADDLIMYLKSGSISIDSFVKKLNYNIRDLQQLLRVHFILQPEVIKFVQALPNRLRRIKTSTTKILQVLEGSVRGRIEWQQTLKARSKQGLNRNDIFACTRGDKNFNIKENIVLKELLGIIRNILFDDLQIDQQDTYKWLADWIDNHLYNQLGRVYSRNIYLTRVNINGLTVTDRMISDTMKSRNILYREAAQLLSDYRKLTRFNIDRGRAVQLLNQTFITPQNADVLFELYWVIRIIREHAISPTINLIDKGANLIATWQENGFYYSLYHDSRGPNDLQFLISLDELVSGGNEYARRVYNANKAAQEVASQVLRVESNNTYWQGRPDIILEVRDSRRKLIKLLLGECKYTNKKQYAKEGLRELLEYMYLVKDRKGYYQGPVEGALFVDSVQLQTDYSGTVRIVSTSRKNVRL